MEKINVNLCGEDRNLIFKKSNYRENENDAIIIFEVEKDCGFEEIWGNLTVNLSIILMPGFAYLDVNRFGNSEVIKYLEENNYIKNTGISTRSGFVNYPLYDINSLLSEIDEL